MEYLTMAGESLVGILPLSAEGTKVFGLILLGTLIGSIVGILPGVGGTTSMMLAIPFLYHVDPALALTFLVALHAVVATSGDLTSILFGIPGEATTAATVVDGHKLASYGQSERALAAALASSLIGAIFGAVLLAAVAPLVRPLVLSVGAGEQFMLVLFGITYVAALSGQNLLAGLVMGGLGLLLATVGMDPSTGIPRLTFDFLLGAEGAVKLWDGMSIIAVSLGLFSVPAIADMIVKDPLRPEVPTLSRVFSQGFRDTLRHLGLVLRSSAIGTYIGLLPGVGGSVAQWIAYAHAAQRKPTERAFGDGAIEGVIAPSAANNSKEGGSMVPTLAFGIPGSLSMTILLVAFILFGVTPGIGMLEPSENLRLTYSFAWTIVVANTLVVLLALLALPQLVRLAYVPRAWSVPFLILFTVIGSYAIRNSLFDLAIVLVFGLLGLVMRACNWPRPPLLLGLVLGGVAETSLHIAFNAYGFNWLLRPGVLLIAALIIGALVWRARRSRTS